MRYWKLTGAVAGILTFTWMFNEGIGAIDKPGNFWLWVLLILGIGGFFGSIASLILLVQQGGEKGEKK